MQADTYAHAPAEPHARICTNLFLLVVAVFLILCNKTYNIGENYNIKRSVFVCKAGA